jgi:rhombotail lipoprotein
MKLIRVLNLARSVWLGYFKIIFIFKEDQMKIFRILLGIMLVCALLSGITGCASTSRRYSSSVVQYLYPDQTSPVATSGIPLLALPVKVGIAFVPETSSYNYNLTEKDKVDLMNSVSNHFKKYDFVKSIEIIPSAYLTPKGSFSNLDQIQTMFGVDVIALISYDQTQFTGEGLASITYWTLIGAYIVPGEKNDTHTMVDAAVYDIKSRTMLFRSPGISHIKSNATPVNLPEKLREDSLKGFQEASHDLIINLDEQLALFKEKVKTAPQDFRVVKKAGYTGGGGLDLFFLCIVIALAVLMVWTIKKEKA